MANRPDINKRGAMARESMVVSSRGKKDKHAELVCFKCSKVV